MSEMTDKDIEIKKELIDSIQSILNANKDNDFVNELLHNHYSNEVKNMTEKEFKEHLENIGLT